MTTSALGIWTPGDTDDWDLTIDLAATANSIDTVILNQANTINRRNVPSVANVSERTTFFPSPAQGNRVYRNEYGWEEAYYATFGGSNPSGAAPAGWYPTTVGPNIIVQRSNIGTTSGTAIASLDGGAVLSPSPLMSFTSGGGIITIGQPGEYEVNISTTQITVNGAGQRNIGANTTASPLQSVTSTTYLGMASIANGSYSARFNIRVTAANQTLTPTILQNSGANLNFTTQAAVKYMGPNHG